MEPEEKNYKLYVCLPFLHLDMDEPITMGPIRFFPSDRIGGATVSLHPSIPDEKKNELLLDGLHLLYFSATYVDIFHSIKPPLFEAFTQLMPIPKKPSKEEIDKIESYSSMKEQVYHLSEIESQMCKGLGAALELIYLNQEAADNEERILEIRRMIRAIRYFVHCFYDKFKILSNKGIRFSNKLYEPEEALILSTAFESLFNINPREPAPDLKQKLRPILQLKFGKPVEIIWKWIDGFYDMKTKVIHTGEIPRQMFRENESFTVPFLSFAVKLFIYSIYYKLTTHRLIEGRQRNIYYPHEFSSIEREEVISFLWPEENLLKKISILVLQIEQGKTSEEYLSDLTMLGNIYIHMMKNFYFTHSAADDIDFIPTPKETIEPFIEAILGHSIEKVRVNGQERELMELYPEGLIHCLQKRAA